MWVFLIGLSPPTNTPIEWGLPRYCYCIVVLVLPEPKVVGFYLQDTLWNTSSIFL